MDNSVLLVDGELGYGVFFLFAAVVGFALSLVFRSGDLLFGGVYEGFKTRKHGFDLRDGFVAS